MDIEWLVGLVGGWFGQKPKINEPESEPGFDPFDVPEDPMIEKEVQRILAQKIPDLPQIRKNSGVRPRTFDDFVGNKEVVERLKIAIISAVKRNVPLPHILLYGTQGCGKTTLSNIIAREFGFKLKSITGSTIQSQENILSLLTEIDEEQKKGSNMVLFIDEVHDLPSKDAPESLWLPLMEDFMFYCNDKKDTTFIKPFTIIGATTDPGTLSAPLRDRFPIHCTLRVYTPEELALIIQRATGRLSIKIDENALIELGKRARGNPRT